MKRIAVIGCGFSGLLTAYHLLAHKRESEQLFVTLFEERPEGFGPPYSTSYKSHLLNVPASVMGAFPGRPDDFLQWIEKERSGVLPNTFVPRKLYGRYLRSIFDKMKERHGASLVVKNAAVRAVRPSETSVEITVAGERKLFDFAVLALGNSPPRPLKDDTGRALQDSWRGLSGVKGKVILVGAGLSAVDAVLALQEEGHDGEIVILAPRGLLPGVHAERFPYDGADIKFPWEVSTVREMLSLVRRHSRSAKNWQSVFEWLRPETQNMWRRLSEKERGRFLRHVRPYWNNHRHRIPQEIDEALFGLRMQGRLSVVRTRALAVAPGENGRLSVRTKHGLIEADSVVNCGGPGFGEVRGLSPLIDQLLTEGVVRRGANGLGFDTDDAGFIRDSEGRVHRNVITLGGLRRGALWESVAVREIREQALQVALAILRV